MIDHGDIRHERGLRWQAPTWQKPNRPTGHHRQGSGHSRTSRQAPLWEDVVPTVITTLEGGLRTAFHAFDAIEQMSLTHRVRVVDEIGGLVPDAASSAARAGFGQWATMLVLTAAETRPAWSELCTRWDAMIEASLDAIAAVDGTPWGDDFGLADDFTDVA